jgi:hypothetical protein
MRTLNFKSLVALSVIVCCGCCPMTFAVSPSALLVRVPVDQQVTPIVYEADSVDGLEIANHGGEAPAGGGSVTTLGGASLLATTRSSATGALMTEGLWANMLVSIAVNRDPEVQRISKKIGRTQTMTLLSVAAVSGLGLAQSIVSYYDTPPSSINVTPAHSPTGHDHVHMPHPDKTTSIMGMVGSGVTLATLGVNAIVSKRLQKRLIARQDAITDGIQGILGELRGGASAEMIHPKLSAWVGEAASREFLDLWQVVYHHH